MSIFETIYKTNDKIPLTIRETMSLNQLNQELQLVDWNQVTNPHLFNLKALIIPGESVVVSVEPHSDVFTVDLEIDHESHSYIANGIPVHNTVNLPHDYSFDNFQDIYIDAYKTGHIKGVTTYRSGTMTAVLSSKESETNGYDEEVILDTVKMAESSEATVKVLRAESRKWYMTVVWNETKSRPFALFVQTNHHEKTVTTHDAVDMLVSLAVNKGIPKTFIDDVVKKIEGDSNATKLTRVLSLLLRHGVAIKNIVATMDKVENVFVGSFLFQIKKYLASFIKDGSKAEGETCQECGSDQVVYQEGCKSCKTCGSSKCS